MRRYKGLRVGDAQALATAGLLIGVVLLLALAKGCGQTERMFCMIDGFDTLRHVAYTSIN